jgi:acetyl esterase/lipase
MKIEVKEYTYETMPDYDEKIEGAKEIFMTGEEIRLEYIPDVIYDEKDNTQLHLQIIKPSIFNKPNQLFPCVVFIQGSAWKKQNVYGNVANISKLASKGYVCVIVEYRDSSIAHFPAQIIDGKNAIRYMKANSDLYNVNKSKMIIMGDSSGGHTSAMIGMTSHTDLFDEPINEETLNLSAIIDLYGAVDVTLPYGFPTTLNHQEEDSPEGMLMGYNIKENLDKASIANCKTYASYNYPPMLILHGTKDKTVFAQESVDLYQAIKKEGKDVELYLVRNSDHGGAAFWKDETVNIYDQFIQRCLNK